MSYVDYEEELGEDMFEDEDYEEDFDYEEYDDESGFESFEELAEAAFDDEEAEDQFLGALAGLAAKALPTIASAVVPQVLSLGKKLLRSGARSAVRAAPQIVRAATSIMAPRQRQIRRNPAIARKILARCTRPHLRRRRRRIPRRRRRYAY